MKNLLLLTDFSATADNAVSYGYQLAKEIKANVLLCNVVDIPAQIPQFETLVMPLPGYDYSLSDNEKELNKISERLEHQGPHADFRPVITCIEEAGRLSDVVTNLTQRHSIDLVIMGIHVNKGIIEWALGNHVNELIDLTKIPVLVIPKNSRYKKIRKMALAANHNNKELNAVSLISKLAKKLNAELFLFRVLDDQHGKEEIMAERGLLTEIKKLTGEVKFSVRTAVNGSVEKQLRSLSKVEHIDLLMMIHQHKSLLSDLVLGSHSRKMAGITDLPLLVVPENIN